MKKVITYGTFDLFHKGHYNLLKHAKELGDYLIVGVTTQHFDEARGKVNVMDPIMTRIENVKKTGFADEIIVEDHDGQKIEDIQKYGIDIFTVGSDWVGHFDYLNAFCKVIYLPRTPNISSTEVRKGKNRIVRVGAVGTGRLAPRFYDEARYVSGVTITSAYNPVTTDGTADVFSEKCGIPVDTEDYESFIEKVDAVYISSPNETHYSYSKKALQMKRHVLCEKPLAFTKAEAEELYHLAMDNGVSLMEGIKTAYCPGFQQLINVAKSGKIGEIRDITAVFTRLAEWDSKEMRDTRYGGAFLEVGSYPLLPIIKLFGLDYSDIRIDSIDGPNGADHYTQVFLKYKDGFATAKAGIGVKNEGQLVIAGTKGYIQAQSPWWLTRRYDIRYEDPDKIEHYEPNFQGDGYRYELAEFVRKINGNRETGYKLTSQESIFMAEVIEKFMRQRGRI